ncbi:MAG TPA: helix-turn-helix domain-containing protein [Gaiellaceae bacterium]|nr:helix-turn-helix domain-containing protein [Gaiellaceae bacterium]
MSDSRRSGSSRSGASPDPDECDVRRAARIRFALRRFHAGSDRVARRSGLTPRQYLLLLAIQASDGRRRGVTVGELVEKLALADSTVTELLDRAERLGLVVRRTGRGDRRTVEIDSTAEGQRRFAAAFVGMAGERRAIADLARDLGLLDHETSG